MEKFVEKGDCSMTLYGLAAEFFFQKQPFNSVLKKKGCLGNSKNSLKNIYRRVY